MQEPANPLSGAILSILLVAFLLVLPFTFLFIKRYRNALIKGMGYASQKIKGTNIEPTITQNPNAPIPEFKVIDVSELRDDTSKIYRSLKETLGYHWFTYGFMCLVFAAVNTYCFAYSSGIFGFWRMVFGLIIFSTAFFPITFMLLVGGFKDTLKFAAVLLFFYLGGIYLIKEYAAQKEMTFFEALGPIVVYNIIPLILIFFLRLKKIKTVGLFIYSFFIVMTAGPFLLYYDLSHNPAHLRSVAGTLTDLNLNSFSVHLILIGVSGSIALVIGWFLFRQIKNLYTSKKINDIQLNADSIILLFNVNYAIFFLLEEPLYALLSLLAFPAYKLAGYLPFYYLRKRKVKEVSPRMLLLRVFALGDDSRNLFERILRLWRYAGSVQMISGPDLATTTLEPHEVVSYVSGNLPKSFCEDEASIIKNVSMADNLPDLDSTHRVNEFFCRDNNWKLVLKELVKHSDVVLMDLRRFTKQFSGCQYEIKALVNLFSLEKIIFIIDKHTDIEFTQEIFREAFREAETNSVNLIKNPVVNLYKTDSKNDNDVFKILNLLCSKVE